MINKRADIFYRSLCREGEAVLNLANSFDEEVIYRVCELLMLCKDRNTGLFVTGVGKSGNVAAKMASTFTSTGIPATYLCPLEAAHGGLGILQKFDMVIAISKSGETSELLSMLDRMKELDITLILITCNKESTLSKFSNEVIVYRAEECCDTGFIPTTSSTVALAIGDALAMACMKSADFKVEDFAKFHPGGSLGEAVRDSIGKIEFNCTSNRNEG
mgnify:CR=1 FL=1